LILESELNRHLLATEWRQLQEATAWLSEATRLGHRARAWWPLLAPVLGVLLVRRFRRPTTTADRTGSWLNWLGVGYSLWKQLATKKRSNGTLTPAR